MKYLLSVLHALLFLFIFCSCNYSTKIEPDIVYGSDFLNSTEKQEAVDYQTVNELIITEDFSFNASDDFKVVHNSGSIEIESVVSDTKVIIEQRATSTISLDQYIAETMKIIKEMGAGAYISDPEDISFGNYSARRFLVYSMHNNPDDPDMCLCFVEKNEFIFQIVIINQSGALLDNAEDILSRFEFFA